MGPEAELYRAFVFGAPPNPMLDVVSLQPEFFPLRDSPQGDVSMRVLGVRVDNRNPFEMAPEVRLHACHHFADEFLEVNTFPELRRNNQFEQSGISGRLPSAELRGYVWNGAGDVKAGVAIAAFDVNSSALILGAGKQARKAEIIRGTFHGKVKGDPYAKAEAKQ